MVDPLALFLIHLQSKSTFDESGEACHDTPASTLRPNEYVAVVCVPSEAMTSPFELPIKLIEHDIAQQRRQGTSLRSPFLHVDDDTVRHDHLGLQQLADDSKDTLITNTPLLHAVE